MEDRMGRLAVVVALAAFLQAEEDLSKLKAPQYLAKVQPNWTKKKGCHVKVEVNSPLLGSEMRAPEKAEFTGKLVKNFMGLRGSAELYGRDAEKLIKQDNLYVEPKRATSKLNRIGTVTRNPAPVMAELFRLAGASSFGADEKLKEEDCRVVQTSADERTVVEQIKEVTGSLKSLEAYYIKDMLAVTDRKKSNSAYKVWFSKKTLLPVRLEWTLVIAMNKKAIPFGADQIPDEFESTYAYDFSKYDTDLHIEVPVAVKQRFGAP
jgi:hypothetical protein